MQFENRLVFVLCQLVDQVLSSPGKTIASSLPKIGCYILPTLLTDQRIGDSLSPTISSLISLARKTVWNLLYLLYSLYLLLYWLAIEATVWRVRKHGE